MTDGYRTGSPARVMVKRMRRRFWGGRADIRVYSDGSARVRVDHPSNDPAVEFAMAGHVVGLIRAEFQKAGMAPPAIGPVQWRDDP